MPHPQRVDFAGQISHVTTHATGWDALFVQPTDYELMRSLALTACRRYAWKIHAYCLMTNHVHFAVETRRATLARGMQWLLGCYAKIYNEDHGRRGHLVKSRYYSKAVETDEQYLECLRYIAMNPVRAGICLDPAAYPWSSYGGRHPLAPPPSPLLREVVQAAVVAEAAAAADTPLAVMTHL